MQIRKQRKEEVLRRKRGLPSNNAAAAAGAAGGAVANSAGTSSLETCLASYLQNPRDLSCHKQLENALSLANNNSSSGSSVAVGPTAAAAAAGTTTATDFLQRLLDEEQAKARALVSNLIDSVQQSHVTLLRQSALGILLEVSSSVKSQDTTYSCTTTNNDDYYGRPPLRWSDLLVSTDEREPNVVMVLLSLLPPPQQQQQQQQQPTINGGDSTVETILNILGNLVQDSPQALSILLPHWAILTSHLPASSYCCAAIIRNDQTHYAMDFLQAQQPQQHMAISSPLQLTQLLRDDRTAMEAAWILEGLSRREDEAVHVLCGRRRRRMVEEETATTSAEETDRLLPCLIQRIHHHANTSTTTASKEFLVPALRAVGNLCTACEGQYVVDFLQQQQPAFVEAMNRLLEQKSVLDAVYVSGSLLTDAGLPGHPSTDTALPNFLPRLIAILLSEHSTFAWKRDAAFAISNAVASSSSSSHSQLPSSPGAVVVYEHDDALLQRMEIESYRLAQLRYYVWTDSEEHQQRLMQVLGGEFLKITPSSSSHEAVVPALQILDKLVRNIEASRFLFDSHGGVDLLEDVCANSSSTTDEAAEIAARLIDDIFDTDDGDSIDYEASSLSLPAIENNQFVFGGAPAIAAFRSNSATSMETTSPPQAGAGRGRGRTMPAWMVQQQQQQQS